MILLWLCIFLFVFFPAVSGGKVIYLYSWFIPRAQVSDCWQFIVTAGVFNLGAHLERDHLTCLCFCITVPLYIEVSSCFSRAFLRELFPLIPVCSFSALTTGKGFLEILQFFFFLFSYAVSMLQLLLCTSFCISWLSGNGLSIPVVSLATQGAIYWLPPCSSVC